MPEVSAGDQVPLVSGVPPRLRNRSTGLSEEQASKEPSSPAFGRLRIETVTSAESSGQEDPLETV